MKWSLAIATYHRPASLQKCLEFAMGQTRPPDEIVIVDASDDWQANRQIAQSIFENVLYLPATIRGLTSQRNQLLQWTTGDVIFLMDDDSFMHASCAAEIIKIYEADVDRQVAGVGAVQTLSYPGAAFNAAMQSGDSSMARRLISRVRNLFERELYTEALLLPYDEKYPDHPIPSNLAHLNIGAARYFDGFRMTFRRDIISRVGFDESLRKYASAEDMDASYRASRFGALVNAYDAKVFHDKSPIERLSRYTRELLGHLNLAYLYCIKGHDPQSMMKKYRTKLSRRMIVDTIRDISKKRFTLPCARADLRTILMLRNMMQGCQD